MSKENKETKVLNDEDLNKVSGGLLNCDDPEYLQYEAMCPRSIDKYDTVNYLGQNVLITYYYHPADLCSCTFASSNWVYGTLISSYEKEEGCGTTDRTAVIRVIAAYDVYSNSEPGDVREYNLDYWNCSVA